MTPTLPVRLEEGPLAVRTSALSKRYGGVPALESVDLQLPEGSVYLLVGPNGAGKTTLLRILLDLVRADSGNAELLRIDSRREGPRLRAQVGYVPERHDWGYGWMTVGRLLQHHSVYYRTWDGDYARHLAAAFDIPMEQRYGRLSKGQGRRVQLVMALAHRPPVLVFDEPTDGLDPVMRDEMMGMLAEHLAETPTTVLVSTHLVHEFERLADYVGVIRAGVLRAQMPLDLLRRGLRRYRAEVPEGWRATEALNGTVLHRAGSAREILWTVWGDEAEVVSTLSAAGATVREAATLSLEDATIALLSRKESAR
jgi:ABC-2 type transport system ATP-binding protein